MVDTSASFNAVDLSRLPAPEIIETLSFEAIRAEMIADFQALYPAFDATVESDPVVKLIEQSAYREILLRQRVNDAARAVMPAYAVGADLDQIAVLHKVSRLILDEGDPDEDIAPTYESDEDFRRRAFSIAPEGYSVAGPEGAYIFHALTADGDVLDAGVTSPTPGEVLISILSRSGTGLASAPLRAAVLAACSAETVRPLTDHVTVQSATIVNYSIAATVKTLSGPDPAVVIAASNARLADYIARVRRIGMDVTRAGIIGALFSEGVQNVTLTTPAADVVIGETQAGYCTAIAITNGGLAE
jgi:phage-related baseplate assembly protein